jgi:hypothetical protein
MQMGKRGPKPTGEYSSKGATLSARITTGTRAQLEKAASESGLSLSQEVEARLARSLAADQSAFGDFGFSTEFWLCRLIAEAIKHVDEFTGQSWRTDPFTFEVMASAIASFLKAFRPAGELAMPETIKPLRDLRATPREMQSDLRKFLSAIRIDAWGEMFATGLLQSLERAVDEDRDAAALAVYRQAAAYLERLQTELSDGSPHNGFSRGKHGKTQTTGHGRSPGKRNAQQKEG